MSMPIDGLLNELRMVTIVCDPLIMDYPGTYFELYCRITEMRKRFLDLFPERNILIMVIVSRIPFSLIPFLWFGQNSALSTLFPLNPDLPHVLLFIIALSP